MFPTCQTFFKVILSAVYKLPVVYCVTKFTKKKAKSLGLVGWVRNTEQGTVTGIAQGPEDKVKVM